MQRYGVSQSFVTCAFSASYPDSRSVRIHSPSGPSDTKILDSAIKRGPTVHETQRSFLQGTAAAAILFAMQPALMAESLSLDFDQKCFRQDQNMFCRRGSQGESLWVRPSVAPSLQTSVRDLEKSTGPERDNKKCHTVLSGTKQRPPTPVDINSFHVVATLLRHGQREPKEREGTGRYKTSVICGEWHDDFTRTAEA